MQIYHRLVALVAAAFLACAPAVAQKLSMLPPAAPLTGTEAIAAAQGAGCTTQALPCGTVATTPAQIATYLATTFQASDADLTAIAALSTTPFGRGILALADAPTVRGYIGLGSNATDSTARVPTSLTISTSAPLAGGGALTGNLSLAITAASSSAAGTMSAADKAKLDGIAAGATANTGTVTSVSGTGANGVTVSTANGTTTPALTVGLGAITPTSVATGTISGTTASFTGAMSASNFAGTSTGSNTGDQTLTGDVTSTGAGAMTATTIGANKVGFAKIVAATQPALIGATAAGMFGEITPAAGRALLGVSATGADPNFCLITGCTFTGNFYRDANFYMGFAGAVPGLVMGSGGSYIGFDRSALKYTFYIANVAVASIDSSGNLKVKGVVTAMTTP